LLARLFAAAVVVVEATLWHRWSDPIDCEKPAQAVRYFPSGAKRSPDGKPKDADCKGMARRAV
jgi:hypothetical protein